MSLEIKRLSHALGAEIRGLNLTQAVDERVFGEINAAFLEHGILLFRDQDITPEQHIEFSRGFGELDRHETLPRDRHPQHPEILMVTNRPNPDGTPSDSRYTGRKWHSDMSFTLRPAMGSLLHGREMPEVGGDTMFSNMYLAYETLSATMKQVIQDLQGVHTMSRTMTHASAERMKIDRDMNPPIAQPIVRIHPETGRKALYISEKVEFIAGMTREESAPLIDFLCRHATRPEFVYRHQWRRHDLLMWDNRCTMHIALADFDERERRELYRTTVLGTPSGQVYEGAL